MLGHMPALDGLQHSAAQFTQAANNFVRATLPAQGGKDTVDLSTAAVAVLESRNSFDANTKLIKTADEMDRTLINAIG